MSHDNRVHNAVCCLCVPVCSNETFFANGVFLCLIHVWTNCKIDHQRTQCGGRGHISANAVAFMQVAIAGKHHRHKVEFKENVETSGPTAVEIGVGCTTKCNYNHHQQQLDQARCYWFSAVKGLNLELGS